MAVISIPLTNFAATPLPGGLATARPNLLDLDLKGCEALVTSLGHKAFNGRNLFKWIHKHGVLDFEAMTDLSLGLRTQLHDTTEIRPPRLAEEWPSADGTRKWMMELADGQRVETVLIPLLIPQERRNTLCVSSQVGCALNCSFCATARQGFNRNLTPGEIIGQVWHATRWLGVPPSNVVLMGMGEPLLNFDNTVAAVSLMLDDHAYGLSRRRVTISTSGIVPAMDRLREQMPVALAVSLHAPNDALRDELDSLKRRLLEAGWKVGEITIHHRPRKFGHSKYGVRRFVKGFLDLLTVCFLTGYSQRPQHLFGTLGLCSFLLGGVGVLALTVWWVVSRTVPELNPVHLHERAIFYYSMAAMLLGAQFITAGFLAEMLTASHTDKTASYSIRQRIGPR